jgi:hypothetical protein
MFPLKTSFFFWHSKIVLVRYFAVNSCPCSTWSSFATSNKTNKCWLWNSQEIQRIWITWLHFIVIYSHGSNSAVTRLRLKKEHAATAMLCRKLQPAPTMGATLKKNLEKARGKAWDLMGSPWISWDIAQSVSCLTFCLTFCLFWWLFLAWSILFAVISQYQHGISWHSKRSKAPGHVPASCASWTKQIARSKRLPSAPRHDKGGHHDEWYYSAKPFWRNWTTTLQELGHTNLDHHDRTRCIQDIYM